MTQFRTAILVAAAVLIANTAQATAITLGSIHSSYTQYSDGNYTDSFTLTLIGDGLNITVVLGGPRTPSVGYNQPYCATNGMTCTPYNLSTTFSFELPVYSTAPPTAVTVGGITYTNAPSIIVTGSITSAPQSAVTTCSPCPYTDPGHMYHDGNFSTTWGPFAFTFTGTVTVNGLHPVYHVPVVLAQDTFSGSGFATARELNNYLYSNGSEVHTADLTFTPEPSSLAFIGIAAIGAALLRHKGTA